MGALDIIKKLCNILTDNDNNEYLLLNDLDYIVMLTSLLPELEKVNQKLYYETVIELIEISPPFTELENLLVPGHRLSLDDIPKNFHVDYPYYVEDGKHLFILTNIPE